jgi:hypothetical protein
LRIMAGMVTGRSESLRALNESREQPTNHRVTLKIIAQKILVKSERKKI